MDHFSVNIKTSNPTLVQQVVWNQEKGTITATCSDGKTRIYYADFVEDKAVAKMIRALNWAKKTEERVVFFSLTDDTDYHFNTFQYLWKLYEDAL